MPCIGCTYAAGLLFAIESECISAEFFAPECVFDALPEEQRLAFEPYCQIRLTDGTRQLRRQTLCLVDISLHLRERDRAGGERPVRMHDAVAGIFPSLIVEPLFCARAIFHESVVIGIALAVNPGECGEDLWPDAPDGFCIACPAVIEPGEQHEQRRRVNAAVILAERYFAGARHFSLAHFMEDLAGLRIARRIVRPGLGSGKKIENAASETRIDPEELERGDDPVAAEWSREPRYAGVRVRTVLRFGRQHVKIGDGPAQDFIEESIRGRDRRTASRDPPLLADGLPQARAETGFARHLTGAEIDKHPYFHRLVGRECKIKDGVICG